MGFLGWLVGRERARRRPGWWRWTARSIAVLVVGYVLLYGPGIRLWRSPPGFDALAGGGVTVFYQPGMEDEATLVAASVREAERDVLAFWGRNGTLEFDFPVDVYLCRSPRRYWHLIMNRAKASASGNDLLIHASYPDHERIRFLRHELAHLYASHELGWLRSRVHMPAWLDEGIATTLQESDWNDRYGLTRFASRCGELAPISTTPSVLRWLGAVTRGGDCAGVQYSYVRAFTEDLVERFGRESVVDYFVQATATGDHAAAFSEVFGLDLGRLERQWIADATRSGLLPADLELVDRGLPWSLIVKILILLAMLTFAAAWIFRQGCRGARAIARAVRPPSPPSTGS